MPELPGTGAICRSSGLESRLNLACAASVRVTPGEAAIMSAKAGEAASNVAASMPRYGFIADILPVMSLAGGWAPSGDGVSWLMIYSERLDGEP